MRFRGHMVREGSWWAVFVPVLGVATQGRTRLDGYRMAADAIETMINKEIEVTIHPGPENTFELSAAEPAPLIAFMLRRLRRQEGLTLKEVAQRLGARSHNAYARYEQGRAMPSLEMLSRLVSAVLPDEDIVLSLSTPVRPPLRPSADTAGG